MSRQSKRPPIDMALITKSKERLEEAFVTESPSPTIALAKKRKSKLTNRKTNQQLIQESHEALMDYVDTVDNKVQDIIQKHEAQFLVSYKEHIKKVRQEMEDIKRRTVNNSNSEKAHYDKIEALQKQLAIFREQSLKLFNKIIQKDKQIEMLNMQVKQLQGENKTQEKTIYSLSKKNKDLEVALQKMRLKNDQGIEKRDVLKLADPRQIHSANKNYHEFTSPIARHLLLDHQPRPYTTSIKSQRSKNMSVRLQVKNKKDITEQLEQLSWVKQKIEERVGDSRVIPIDTIFNIISQRRQKSSQSRKIPNTFRKAKSNFVVKMESRRSALLFEQDEVKKISEDLVNKNELQSIFRNCVSQVKKEVIRKNNIPSLNYFKQNGPRSYIEFKKIDHFALLELLFREEKVLQALYNIIFN